MRSLRSENPVMAAMWHPTKNGALTPEKVLPGNKVIVGGFVLIVIRIGKSQYFVEQVKKGVLSVMANEFTMGIV